MGKEIFELIEQLLNSSGIKIQSVMFDNKGHVNICLTEPIEIKFVPNDKNQIITISSGLFKDLLIIVHKKNYTMKINKIDFEPVK